MAENGDGEARLAGAWARIRGRLRQEFGETEYRNWFQPATFVGVDGEEAVIALPSKFLADWIRGRYGDRLRSLWAAEDDAIRRIEFVVGTGAGIVRPRQNDPADADPRPDAAEAAPNLDKRLKFETFVVGKPNEFAHACARRVAAQPAAAGFNPLFIYGGVGLGKTHLMHAIAWEILETADRVGGKPPVVAYLSAEQFMYRFITSLRAHTAMEFKETLRATDVLLIDDIQFLIGKDNTQEEFFHTFNFLVDAGKQIIVSADKSPAELAGLGDRLRTRLGSGIVADLHATTFELRMAILEAKIARSDVPVPRKALEFLAARIATNIRELEGALNRLIAHAHLFGREITMETINAVLPDLLRQSERRITVEEIQRRVSEHYNLRLADMTSPRRSRNIARPRQVAMYLSKVLTTRSLPEIGRRFGNRDHTTVMHAVSRIGELMAVDDGLAEDVAIIRRLLEN